MQLSSRSRVTIWWARASIWCLPVKHPGDDALGGDLFAEFVLLAALGGLGAFRSFAASFLFAEAAFIATKATSTRSRVFTFSEFLVHVLLNTPVTFQSEPCSR